MFGHEGANGLAVGNQRLERNATFAEGDKGHGGEQADREQWQQPADRTALLVGGRRADGHPRYIHEPCAQAGRSHRLVSHCDLAPGSRFWDRRVALTGQAPSLISRANLVPIRTNSGFDGGFEGGFDTLAATVRPAEN